MYQFKQAFTHSLLPFISWNEIEMQQPFNNKQTKIKEQNPASRHSSSYPFSVSRLEWICKLLQTASYVIVRWLFLLQPCIISAAFWHRWVQANTSTYITQINAWSYYISCHYTASWKVLFVGSITAFLCENVKK